jgi:hypothetical protein
MVCQGFTSLLNSVSGGRTATSKWKLSTDQNKSPTVSSRLYLSTITNHKVKAGGELTIDYGDRADHGGIPDEAPERLPEWLRENGLCVDQIRVSRSSLPDTEYGAFATRKIEKDTIVIPVPLLGVKDRSVLRKNGVDHKIVNYSFHVPGSNMLLFPYGPVVGYINHDKSPNVGLRWSESSLHYDSLLSLQIDQFWDAVQPGQLILEVFALRDVYPGEELFLDYGDVWNEVWANRRISASGDSDWKAEFRLPVELPLHLLPSAWRPS